jgi:hypothetical protein
MPYIPLIMAYSEQSKRLVWGLAATVIAITAGIGIAAGLYIAAEEPGVKERLSALKDNDSDARDEPNKNPSGHAN